MVHIVLPSPLRRGGYRPTERCALPSLDTIIHHTGTGYISDTYVGLWTVIVSVIHAIRCLDAELSGFRGGLIPISFLLMNI